MIEQFKSLIEDDKYLITTLSNTSAFLNQILGNINWVGFYLFQDNQLVLGPFQGKVACKIIPLDKGVCGKAAREKTTVVVKDVHQFAGHIACDSASNSEIVIPIIINNILYGVLDIDSPIFNRFEKEKNFLEEIVYILEKKIETII